MELTQNKITPEVNSSLYFYRSEVKHLLINYAKKKGVIFECADDELRLLTCNIDGRCAILTCCAHGSEPAIVCEEIQTPEGKGRV